MRSGQSVSSLALGGHAAKERAVRIGGALMQWTPIRHKDCLNKAIVLQQSPTAQSLAKPCFVEHFND